MTPVYDDRDRRSLSGVTDILNVAIFKYSLHKFREMILHRKCQLI